MNQSKSSALFVLWCIALLLLIFTAFRSVRLIQSTLPEDAHIIAFAGLAGLDGYETARRLRGLPGGEDMLLVAITGYGDDEAVARSRAAGFDYHLVKPFDPKALLRLLSRPIAGNHDLS